MNLDSKKRYLEFLYILFIFFTTSLIGGLLESFYVWFRFGFFDIGGFMYGPWRPIYGIGCLLLYFITKSLKETERRDLYIFTSCATICTIFEYLSSLLLEVIFHRTWWNYRGDLLNINGRVSLFTTIIWGFLGLFFVGYLEPNLKKGFEKFTKKQISILLFCLSLTFLVDYAISFLHHI